MLSYNFNRANRLMVAVMTRQRSATSDPKSVQPPKPHNISSDMIGPPDPVSNLRRIVFRKPQNETALEKKYRELRIEVQEWNQNFWTQHNSRFFKEREDYLKKNLPEGKTNLTADEMSVFYKAFLDKNWKAHLNYNKEWYKKNVILLGLAIQEREDYLKKNLPEGKTNLTADEMSVFYKAFLDKNWKAHLNYNKEWYKKNVILLGLAIQVKITKLLGKK